MDTPYLVPEQYNILWTSSWMALFPTLIALNEKQYDLALCSGSVFLSSINYWKYPINNWCKRLDITVVRMSLMYQLYKCYKTKNVPYLLFSLSGICSYYLGDYYFRQNKYWIYTYFHFGLHFMGNLGNFALLKYSK